MTYHSRSSSQRFEPLDSSLQAKQDPVNTLTFDLARPRSSQPTTEDFSFVPNLKECYVQECVDTNGAWRHSIQIATELEGMHITFDQKKESIALTLIETASLMRAITEDRDRFLAAGSSAACAPEGCTEHLIKAWR